MLWVLFAAIRKQFWLGLRVKFRFGIRVGLWFQCRLGKQLVGWVSNQPFRITNAGLGDISFAEPIREWFGDDRGYSGSNKQHRRVHLKLGDL